MTVAEIDKAMAKLIARRIENDGWSPQEETTFQSLSRSRVREMQRPRNRRPSRGR